LGTDNPKQLSDTLFFLAGKFFALRGGSEHRDLEWGKQVNLVNSQEGEILVYSNNFNKNFNGGIKQSNIKPKEVRVYQNTQNAQRCFIKIYKKYSSLRPENGKSKAFYLRPKTVFSENKWFDDMAIGHNTLSQKMKTMSDVAGLAGNFTNHSLKKTAATQLRHCSEVQRRAITGNRSSAQSVYEIVTESDYKQTSNILYNIDSNEKIISGKSTENQTSGSIVHCETVNLAGSPSKKMRIDMDGNTNKITITFD